MAALEGCRPRRPGLAPNRNRFIRFRIKISKSANRLGWLATLAPQGEDQTPLGRPNPARTSRTTARSSAERNAERSRGANGFGPPVISPALRSESIRLRVASFMPIESLLKALPFGAMTSAPDLTQRL